MRNRLLYKRSSNYLFYEFHITWPWPYEILYIFKHCKVVKLFRVSWWDNWISHFIPHACILTLILYLNTYLLSWRLKQIFPESIATVSCYKCFNIFIWMWNHPACCYIDKSIMVSKAAINYLVNIWYDLNRLHRKVTQTLSFNCNFHWNLTCTRYNVFFYEHSLETDSWLPW